MCIIENKLLIVNNILLNFNKSLKNILIKIHLVAQKVFARLAGAYLRALAV